MKLQTLKRTGLLLLACLMVLILFTGCGKETSYSNAKTIATPANYSLIPVLTLDNRAVFLNASVTPLEFFSVQCPHCEEDLPKLQKMVSDIKSQKPIIYVGTFYDTDDQQKAIQETKDFIEKHKLSGTFVVQTGAPDAYVKNVPALVSMEQGQTEPIINEGLPNQEELTKILTTTLKAPVVSNLTPAQ